MSQVGKESKSNKNNFGRVGGGEGRGEGSGGVGVSGK